MQYGNKKEFNWGNILKYFRKRGEKISRNIKMGPVE
jgi:hypothetical protein